MTIANDHTVMNNADNEQNWTVGGTSQPDAPRLNNSASTVPFFIDDGNDAAIEFSLKKGTDGYTYTDVIPANFDASGGGIFVFWILYLADVYTIPIEYLAVRLSSSTGFTTNYREWKFVDSTGGDAQEPELNEGWTPCRIYPDAATADGDTSNGTLTVSDIESYGIRVLTGQTADGKFGGFDKCIYISEMQMHSSVLEGFEEMYSDATNGSRPNRLAAVEQAGAFFKFNVNIRIGDASATGTTTLNETGKTVFFDNIESSHELGFIIEGHATFNTNFQLTDTSVFWNSQPSTALIWTGLADVDNFQITGCAFSNGGQINPPANAVGRWIRSTKFDNCQAGTISDGEFTSNTVSNGKAITVTGAADLRGTAITTPSVGTDESGLVWNGNVDPSGKLDNMTFSKGTNGHHAIEFGTSSPLTMTLVGIDFQGFAGANGLNNSTLYIKRTTGTVTINLSGVTGNVSYKTDGATVVINNSVPVTFSNLKDNSEVRIYAAGTNTELAGIEDAVDGTADNRTFTASIGAGTSVDYVIHNFQPGDEVYQSIRVNGFTWPSTSQTITIQQQIDRNVEN